MPDDDGIIWSIVPYTGEVQPEWLVLGKRHADRAKQFKPFDALRGYDERIQAVLEAARQSDGRFPSLPQDEDDEYDVGYDASDDHAREEGACFDVP